MTAGRDAENRPAGQSRVEPFTPEQAVKVSVFGFDRPPVDDVDGMRAGFVVVGVMTLGLIVLGVVVVWLAGVWSR